MVCSGSLPSSKQGRKAAVDFIQFHAKFRLKLQRHPVALERATGDAAGGFELLVLVCEN
jgi:hypothetical protein